MVFDTKRLCELLPLEQQTYHYSTIGAGDVIYDDEKDKIEDEFRELFDNMKKIHSEMLEDISDGRATAETVRESDPRWRSKGRVPSKEGTGATNAHSCEGRLEPVAHDKGPATGGQLNWPSCSENPDNLPQQRKLAPWPGKWPAPTKGWSPSIGSSWKCPAQRQTPRPEIQEIPDI